MKSYAIIRYKDFYDRSLLKMAPFQLLKTYHTDLVVLSLTKGNALLLNDIADH